MIKNVIAFRKELDKVNDFWINNYVKELKTKKLIFREIFNGFYNELNTKRILILTGPRRVGKTILIKQCIEKLASSVGWQNILYYSMDDPSLFTYSDNLIKDMIDYWTENIAKEGKKYIFLDEIHLYKGWYKWVKAYHDRYDDIKFVLSGSSSLFLQREANRYLRGRTIEIELYPLNFREFLELSGLYLEFDVKFAKLTESLRLEHIELEKIKKKIEPVLKQYLLVGGFPEWFEIKNEQKWFSALINDIPKKAVYEDIVELFNLKNPKILEQILTFILTNQSRPLSYESINEVAKLDRSTLVNYIEFLKSSYLVIEILKFSKNIKEQIKSMKKYLCIDQGLRNALTKEYSLKEDNIGFIIENIIGLHLFFLAKKYNNTIFYFKTNSEVDFVHSDKIVVPIEVKYKEDIKAKEIKSLLKFMEKSRIKRGIIITKDILKEEVIDKKKILFIPAWLFLLSG